MRGRRVEQLCSCGLDVLNNCVRAEQMRWTEMSDGRARVGLTCFVCLADVAGMRDSEVAAVGAGLPYNGANVIKVFSL